MSVHPSTLDPHHGEAEALAAAVAMRELYGSPKQGEGRMRGGRLISTYAVGDSVSVAFAEGHRRCVVVDTPQDDEGDIYHVVQHVIGGGRRHHAVSVDAIAPW